MSQDEYAKPEEDIITECIETYLDGDLVSAVNLISDEKYAIPKDVHELADIKYSLATYFYDSFHEEYAIDLFSELIEYGKKEFGETHNTTLIYMLRKVACTFVLQEDMEESLKICIFVYNERVKKNGKNHTSTLTALNWVAGFYDKLGHFDSSLRAYKKAYKARVKTLGQSSDLTLNTLAYIGHLYYNHGEKEKAYEIFIECYDLRSKAFGKTNDKTLALKNWIGNCLNDFEDYEGALRVFKEIKSDIKQAGVSTAEDHNAEKWTKYLESIIPYKKQLKFLPNSYVSRMLVTARKYDDKCNHFGCAKHCYLTYPTSFPEHIEPYELKHKIIFPDDYKYFLLNIGNGGAGPHYGILSLSKLRIEGDPSVPMHFTSETSEDEWYDMVENAFEREEDEENFDAFAYMLDGLIGISEQGCGFFTYLCVTGQDRGKIFYIDDMFDYPPSLRPCIDFLEWYKCWLEFVSTGNNSGRFDQYFFEKFSDRIKI